MIADRHVFVVRQQRIVGPEQLAGVGGVVDAGKEVGVVADRGRTLEAAIGGAVEEPGAQTLDPVAVLTVGIENLREAMAQRHAGLASEREQRVQRRAGSGLRGLRGKAGEEAELQRRREIEDVVADGDAAARRAARRREHAERQVLDREVGMLVRRDDPAASLGAVRGIDHVRTVRARDTVCRASHGCPCCR